MKSFIKKLCLFAYWLIGWEAVNLSTIRPKKFVFIVAPHTSNWDFVVGIIAKYIFGYGYNTKFLAKSSLFESPFGFFFYWLGGLPVYRSKHTNMVDQVVARYDAAEGEFGIALTPEGTRKYVKDWHTGFYHIAVRANAAIVPVGLDYGRKKIIMMETFFPTGNQEEDMKALRSLFKDMKALYPECYNYEI